MTEDDMVSDAAAGFDGGQALAQRIAAVVPKAPQQPGRAARGHAAQLVPRQLHLPEPQRLPLHAEAAQGARPSAQHLYYLICFSPCACWDTDHAAPSMNLRMPHVTLQLHIPLTRAVTTVDGVCCEAQARPMSACTMLPCSCKVFPMRAAVLADGVQREARAGQSISQGLLRLQMVSTVKH